MLLEPDIAEAALLIAMAVVPVLAIIELLAGPVEEAPLAAQVVGTAEGRVTWTLSQSCIATCKVVCLSDSAVHCVATQQDMPLMKDESEQMHLTSR